MRDFDPFAAIDKLHEDNRRMREQIGEAIHTIESDRPNAAKRLLV